MFASIKNVVVSLLIATGLVSAPAVPNTMPVINRVDNPDSVSRLYVETLENRIAKLEEQLKEDKVLGATRSQGETAAFFETALQASINTTATTFTLLKITDKAGTNLASSTYAFVIDEGEANEEIVIADCFVAAAKTCNNAVRGVSSVNGTSSVSALKKDHRRGATVKITDAPALLYLNNVFNGKQAIEVPIKYNFASSTLKAGSRELASVDYVDGVALAGCGTATQTSSGCSELATAAEAASSTSGALVLPASIATSTPGNATTRQVVMSENDGKLNQSWLDLSESFAFTSNVSSTASSTFSGATTTISNLSITNNDISANGLSLRLPSQITASSTSIMTDLYGNLIFDTPQTPQLLTTITASGTVGTLVAEGLSARQHYTAILSTKGKSTANSFALLFNQDTGNTYAYRYFMNYAQDGVANLNDNIQIFNGTTTAEFYTFEISNFSDIEKQVHWTGSASSTKVDGNGRWNNTTAQITSIRFRSNGGGFLADSKLWIYGSRD